MYACTENAAVLLGARLMNDADGYVGIQTERSGAQVVIGGREQERQVRTWELGFPGNCFLYAPEGRQQVTRRRRQRELPVAHVIEGIGDASEIVMQPPVQLPARRVGLVIGAAPV